ncbi:12219_t:CDS:2, partial [Racocetra fulgida]
MSEDNYNVPASKFIPLLREIVEVADKLAEFYQNVKYKYRQQTARASISSLEICANEFPESIDFFTLKNNIILRNFKHVIRKFEEFIRKVQDIHNYRLFFEPNFIKNEFYGLINEFDEYMKLLKFSIPIEISAKNIDLINKDTDEMKEYLRSIIESTNKEQINKIKEIKLSDNELLQKINMHIQNVENFIRNKDAYDKPKKQDLIRKEISTSAILDPDDFIIDEQTQAPLKELEFKIKRSGRLDLQIGILKTINGSQDIIQYIGLVTINSQQFLVTEWAEYGTLREYYEMKNPDITIRARLALEIAHSDLPMLSFEEAVELTNLKSGSKDSKERSWKTIAKYSETDNDFTAKYWKGYYLFYKLIDFPYSDDERMQLTTDAFKEAADGANTRDAQFMYASCIYKKDPYMAIEYFEKAAEQNYTVAMHNLGLLYYNGKYVDADKKK